MILIDTSIWIDHFRSPSAEIIERVELGEILSHPFVMGELLLGGGLRQRGDIAFYLNRLPSVLIARHGEVMKLIERAGLVGSGIGWVDAHLLCAAKLTFECSLWTRDRRLEQAAQRLGVAH